MALQLQYGALLVTLNVAIHGLAVSF